MSAIEILIPNTQHLVEVIPQIGSLFFATFQVLPSVLMSLQGSFRSKIYVGVPATLGLSATEQLTDVLEKRMTDAKELTRVSVLTLIGANVQQCVPCLKKALHALEGLPLRFINTNSSHDSLSVVVAPQDRHEALTRLHALLNAETTTDLDQ
jgi:aspartokinase